MTEAHRSYFDAPVLTASAQDVLALRVADLDLPFAGHNPDLLAILDPSPGNIAAQSSLAEQVKTLIKRRIASGRPEIAAVARELGLGARTLQRRITEQGVSYRGLLDEARRELGRDLLADGVNGIEEIAFLLGFQDKSAFYRAFRKWEGKSPAIWRNANR